MTSRAEEIACRSLRTLLASLSTGTTIEDSDDFFTFQNAMEFVIPSMLAEAYPYWRYQGLDGFRFAVARTLGSRAAEFVGLCLLVDKQTWTPLYLRLGVGSQRDNIDWLECKLGEAGDGTGGMVETPYGSTRETKLLYGVVKRLGSIRWAYTITRGSPEHAA